MTPAAPRGKGEQGDALLSGPYPMHVLRGSLPPPRVVWPLSLGLLPASWTREDLACRFVFQAILDQRTVRTSPGDG